LKILVTGANGFLGQRVVASLAHAGHGVRALVRPAVEVDSLGWGNSVEVVRSDLRSDPSLDRVFEGVDAVIHLAASMSGSDFSRFNDTVTGTERFFEAMGCSGVKRLVLCSSFSVYDWARASGTVDETLPILEGQDVYERDGYATAKLWQERLARRKTEERGWELTVIRPGFIWGPGNECPDGSIGVSLGPLHFIFCAGRQLPFTHVVNAGDCISAAVGSRKSVGETLNLVDGYSLSAWTFMGEYLRRKGTGGVRIWLPYWLLWPAVVLMYRIARLILGPGIKVPAIFVPARFAQGYRPLRFSTDRLAAVLDWQPPLSLAEALEETLSTGVRGTRGRSRTE